MKEILLEVVHHHRFLHLRKARKGIERENITSGTNPAKLIYIFTIEQSLQRGQKEGSRDRGSEAGQGEKDEVKT